MNKAREGEVRRFKGPRASNRFMLPHKFGHNVHMQALMDFRALAKDLNIYIPWSLNYPTAGRAPDYGGRSNITEYLPGKNMYLRQILVVIPTNLMFI